LTTSALVLMLTSSTAYTQPFSSDGMRDPKSFCDNAGELIAVVVGRQNHRGILTVLVKCIDKATCQRCGLHMTEVKSLHTVGWNGPLHWESRREVKHGIRDDGGVTMTVFLLLTTLSAASEIIVGG
jgi:hypothetical protein